MQLRFDFSLIAVSPPQPGDRQTLVCHVSPAAGRCPCRKMGLWFARPDPARAEGHAPSDLLTCGTQRPLLRSVLCALNIVTSTHAEIKLQVRGKDLTEPLGND